MTLRRTLAATLALIMLGASCGGGGSNASGSSTDATRGASPSRSSAGSGSLLITRRNGIVEFDIKSHVEKTLTPQPTPETFLLDPAVSPDGTRIAYIVQPPPKVQGAQYDAGADLWVANRDGSGAKAVLMHVNPNQLLRFPQWLDDSTLMLVAQEPTQTAGTTTVEYVLERIDLTTGERARLLANVLGYGLSVDRKHIVFAHLSPQGGETLDTANIDGSGATTIVGMDENLSPFNSPRYSPDGSTVAFASADQTGARANVRYVSAPGFGAAAALLNGLPEDLWTVSASGGRARRVAKLREDLPTLAWGADREHIYVLGTNGLTDVDLKSAAVRRIGEGAFHGQIAWAP